MGLGIRPYEKGLTEVADGSWAWIVPDGSWGWSNAGLITDGDASMLVDTLFDLRLTQEMLDEMAHVAPNATAHYDVLVNTHANGDHCHGNELVDTNRIITSAATAIEMNELPPTALAAMVAGTADDNGPLGQYIRAAFGPFEFEGITHVEPTETFSGEETVHVGDKAVHLIEVGPAHTRGDVLVHVPGDSVVYTGDILFIEGTPIMWEGPVANWIAACERIVAMDVDTVVPGHGPITNNAGVHAVSDYLRFIDTEARKRFDAGLSVVDAARDIELGQYAGWTDAERILINVNTLFGEYGSDQIVTNVMELFAEMGKISGYGTN